MFGAIDFLLRACSDIELSTVEIGLAMLEVAPHGAPKSILETADIRGLVKG